MKLPRVMKSKVDRYDYCQNLKKKGYSMIGSGAYAEVWSKPKSRAVIKVGHCNPSCFGIDAYLSYLKLIPSNTKNPLFPKVHSIKLYKHSTYNGFYVVNMERLQSCIDDDYWTGSGGSGILPGTNKLLKSNGITKLTQLETPDKLLKKKTVNRHVKQVCRILKKLYKDYSEDIHGGNIMIREVGGVEQLVLTDPVN